MEEKAVDKKRRRIVVILLLLITICAIGVTVWAVWFRSAPPTLAPDYAPQEVEQSAEPMEETDTSKLEQPEGGGAVSVTYSKSVLIDLSDRTVSLMFGNPTQSNQDMVLQLVIRDTVIVQSGRLTPGNRITSLALLDNAQLAAGTYEGKFVVLFYDQQTGEKAMVNTEIPLSIDVRE